MAISAKKEKITITIPYELKEKLYNLKEELHTSMSAIYQDALQSYIREKEIEKWKKAAKIMEKEYENNPELNDWIA